MEKTIWIYAYWSKYDKEFKYGTQGYAPGPDSEYVVIEERKLTFDSLNDIELRAKCAAALRNKRGKVLADAQLEVNEIDEQIQELLAIEDKSNG